MGKDVNDVEFKMMDLTKEFNKNSPEQFIEYMKNQIKLLEMDNKDVTKEKECLALADKALEKINILLKTYKEDDKPLIDRLKRDIQDYSHWDKETRGDRADERVPPNHRSMGKEIEERLMSVKRESDEMKDTQNKAGEEKNSGKKKNSEKKKNVINKLGKFVKHLKKNKKQGLEQSSDVINKNLKSMDLDSSTSTIAPSSKNSSRKNSKRSVKSIDSDKTM